MDKIQVKDKEFRLSITADELHQQVMRVARELECDVKDAHQIFLCVLNGAFMFAADLMKQLNIQAEIHFVKLSSYCGTSSTGVVKELIGFDADITGLTVLIIEDIVETGFTMKKLTDDLKAKNPKDVRICTLLAKPERLQVDLHLDYVALEIPNAFIVGYGLDYDGLGRNHPEIYSLV